LAARELLAAFALEEDLARISWHPAGTALEVIPEPIAERRRPVVQFSEVAVAVPPGAFLQPTAEGETALVEMVLERLPVAAARVADLYAGCGPFSFALVGRAQVFAAEGASASLEALDTAARQTGLSGRIETACRDLVRQPLTADELARFGCVVFDPPRAGARPQAEQLAASRVPAAIAVSCNPQTFARDARILVDGGFDPVEVVPLDQFPWSAHLELVALFRR
jgi:23S rRNA (uracil1939-C5)-methyltransferase